jgi:putative inorganic carbon (HCO3(-)) transporter
VSPFLVIRPTGLRADVEFILTVVYIVVTIISPVQFGPEWASYHPLLYLAGITFLLSLPNSFSSSRTNLRSSIQIFLMLGFIVAIAFSAVANGWIGGIVASWKAFLPSAAVFFFIVANVTTIRRLKILTLAAVASCLVVVVEALCGYYSGFRGDTFVLQQSLFATDGILGQVARLRGAGFLNDPNDFAQILLIALPLVFIGWQRGRSAVNSLIVFLPAVLLLWAIYLTHSRGALMALGILALMVAQKRLGATTSVVLTAVLILGLAALDFTGGRGISAVDGADRLEAWATGLEMFKRAPLFGVGFGAFTDFNEITAHNSFVLCLAELGLVGATLWVALLVTTMASLNRAIRQQRKKQMKPTTPAGNVGRDEEFTLGEAALRSHESPIAAAIVTVIATDVETAIEPPHHPIVPIHWILAMRLALVGFTATGWFLSRSYATPMYLVLGLATAMIALERPITVSRIRSSWIFFTLAAEAVAVICVYGMVHLRN